MPRKKKGQVESPVAVVEPGVDTDRDGLSDAEELALGSSPTAADTDRDGLTDAEELRLGTDPLQADTDRDGVPDGVEVRGRNPLVNEAAYCPTLAEMWEWRSNAVALDRDREYVAHIGILAGQMLAGTEQQSLPNDQRDPNFHNPAFTLSKGDRQLMQQDMSAVTVQTSRPVQSSEAASGMTATFKHFNGGAMLFDEAAIEAAVFLQLETTPTVKDDPALKLAAEQIEPVRAHLRECGYQIEDIEDKVVHINVYGQSSAIVLGTAAIAAAASLERRLEETNNGNPKLKVAFAELDSLVQALEAQGYRVQEHPREISYKPKAVFFEGQDGETYYLFNRSAQNVAETLNLQLDEREDGRSMLSFDRQSYRNLKEKLQTEHGFEISTNDVKATLALYENDSGKGALINGTAALVVAHAVGATVKHKDFGDGPIPQVNLTEAQIPQAQAVLQANNYRVISKDIELPKTANIRDYTENSIVFGKPAEAIAGHLGLSVQPNQSNDGVHLKIPAARRQEAIGLLQQQGYEIRNITPEPVSRKLVKAGDRER